MKEAILGFFLVLTGMLYDGFATTRRSSHRAVANPSYTTDTLQLDRETSLVIDDRLALVKANCLACHSSKLILQSHLTRDGWRQKIRWMQRTQKLWDLADSEPVVLDYLAKYYGPEDRSFDGRRLPLPKQTW